MNDPQDIVSVLVAIIALIASKEIAHLVGPYAAIVVLASAGASLSLSGHEDQFTYWRAILYVWVRIMVAVVLTVTLAELLEKVVPWASPRYTLVPLAFGIGWIRDYTAIRTWIGSVINRVVGKRVGDEQK